MINTQAIDPNTATFCQQRSRAHSHPDWRESFLRPIRMKQLDSCAFKGVRLIRKNEITAIKTDLMKLQLTVDRLQQSASVHDKDVLTVEGVAHLLHCAVDSARRIPKDELPALDGPGRGTLYLRQDVIKYLRSQPKRATISKSLQEVLS